MCSGYDAYLILSSVQPCQGKFTIISNNMERYTFLKINNVTFTDSCQFMLSSLDKLSSNLSKDQFRETRKNLLSNQISTTNQPQINNMTEGGKVGEVVHFYDDC